MKIMNYNHKKWGGRYNQILVAKGGKLTDQQWDFIDSYDPDVVKTFTKLSKNDLYKFDTKASPYNLIKSRDQYISPHIDDDGAYITPTSRNILQVGNAFGDNVYLVQFVLNDCKDESIKEFIEVNFGVLDERDMMDQVLKKHPNRVQLHITDKASFANALKKFNDFKSYVFPIQLCHLGDYVGQGESFDSEHIFHVFLGDQPHDILNFWRNPLYLRDSTRNRLRQLWIPQEMADDEELTAPLVQLIRGRVNPYGTSGRQVVFHSSSIDHKKLEIYSNKLTKDCYFVTKTTGQRFLPELSDFFSFSRLKEDMIHRRGHSKVEEFRVSPPNEVDIAGGTWMNDLYVELPEKKTLPVNIDTWMQLPRNNNLASIVVNSIARIDKNGLVSVLGKQSNRFNPVGNLEITLPSTREIIFGIVFDRRRPVYTTDLRYDKKKKYPYDLKISNEGKRLSGFMSVFGSINSANSILQDNHWRRFFKKLANVDISKESKQFQIIKDTLNKKSPFPNLEDDTVQQKDRFLERLSGLVVETSKKYVQSLSKTGTYLDLENIVKDELETFNDKHPKNKFKYNKSRVLRSLKYLVELNVLSIGHNKICSSCLYPQWRPVNELDQFMQCAGCGYEYILDPEYKISYKLNSLIENGVRSGGVIPVVLALGALFEDANYHFDFLPPMDIYKNGDKLTDLDICCIKDGKFIIGEIKAQQRGFPKDFSLLVEIAKEIQASKIVISTMAQKPTKNTQKKIEKARKSLKGTGITIDWLNLDSRIFEPSLVY